MYHFIKNDIWDDIPYYTNSKFFNLSLYFYYLFHYFLSSLLQFKILFSQTK